MFYFILHTALLILAAFVLGAIVGCLLKRFMRSGVTYGAGSRPTPAQSAAAAATATVKARTEPAPEPAKTEPAEEKAPEPVESVVEAVETIAADAPTMVEPAVMDDKAAEEALAALPDDASNEDKANAVGTRPPALDAPAGGKKDNLQRIKGIGKVNEGKMNDLGIYHFSQISDWTPAQIRWVGTYLAFAGRIEREDWIGQAQTLASGGETDFAKRVDKGEVETSSGKKK